MSTAPTLTTRSEGISRFVGFGEDAPLDLPDLDRRTSAEVVARLLSPEFDAWSTAAAKVGHCAHPIKLRGHTETFSTATGESLSRYATAHEPLGVLHVRCGNRRASDCPSCSRVYAADTFHLIRAGVLGGKTVPETVASHPLVFLTLTAPSFGPVHSTRNGRRCHPFAGKGEAGTCEHGRSRRCLAFHGDEDPLVGQPICWECYDYLSHVVWQWWAPELWRRYTITLRRHLAALLGVTESRLPTVATVQYAKVAEYQRRGLIHFHALVRLDGPRTPTGFADAPDHLDGDSLAQVLRDAAGSVVCTAPGLFEDDVDRVLRFGVQVDTKTVRTGDRTDDDDQALTAGQVAGYLAKYATKSATDAYPDSATNQHLARLRTVLDEISGVIRDERSSRADQLVDELDEDDLNELVESPYRLLGKWTHMLGFRGHFSSKSRRYSITLGRLRRARRRFHALVAEAARAGQPLDTTDLEARLLTEEDDDETTLVVASWAFAGAGWDTPGDVELAKAAAARAREYAQHRAQFRRQAA